MALSDSRGSLWTQFTTHPPSSGSTVEYTSVDSRYRDGCDKKKKKRQPRVRLSFNVKRHIFATTCLSSWCDLICLRRRWLLLPWRNRRQRCKSHPCVPNWAPSPADVGFNNILLYNLLRKWPAGLQVSLETYFRGMCFIATVNFMRAVKLSGGVCCQRSCCLNQRFNNAPPPKKKKKAEKVDEVWFPSGPRNATRATFWMINPQVGLKCSDHCLYRCLALNFLHWLRLKGQWGRFIAAHNGKWP